MKLKIATILCAILILTTIIPVQSQTVDDNVLDENKLSITSGKIGKTGIFIVKVDESCNDTVNIRISRGIGFLGREYTIDEIPTIRIKFFLIKASTVNLKVSLVNETGCIIETETDTITIGFTSQALIIVKNN